MSSLADRQRYKIFPGNVVASVLRTMDDRALRWAVVADAVTHHAALSNTNFDWMLPFIEANKIEAYRLGVWWNGCARENCHPLNADGTITAGGAAEFRSVITEWDGNDMDFKHYPGTYGEDTYVSPDLSREFRRLTANGLGTYFMYERIKLAVMQGLGLSPYGMISKGRVAEYAENNSPIIGIYKKLHATLENKGQNRILQLNGLPLTLQNRNRVVTLTEGLGRYEGDILSNVFVVNWEGNNGEKIVGSFTEAISTFTGLPIVRVQFTSNHVSMDNEERKDALASIILAGRAEVLTRKHLSDKADWNVDDEEMIMRIHAINEPEINSALQAMGAEIRTIGSYPNVHPMLPVITNFSNIPDHIWRDILGVGVSVPSAIPFVTTPLAQIRELRPGHAAERTSDAFVSRLARA